MGAELWAERLPHGVFLRLPPLPPLAAAAAGYDDEGQDQQDSHRPADITRRRTQVHGGYRDGEERGGERRVT